MIDTSIVDGVSAASSAAGVIMPYWSGARYVTLNCRSRSRKRAVCSTAGCSISVVITWSPSPFCRCFSAATRRIWLIDSVAPDVNTIDLSASSTPSSRAIDSRAARSARAGSSPKKCSLDGLPKWFVRYGHIASATARSTGHVAL